ncbi:MAG TPA: DUF5610 domain-containing protein [Sulfuricella sp.]|nr:DUF5610 domain-containing protein [Sulfuricella sp.]
MPMSIRTPAVERPGYQQVETGKVQNPGEKEAKAQANASILKASMEVSISVKNNTLQLLLTSVIANLNEVLKPEFGDNAIQNAVNQDNTPEGTSGRIVDLATGLFGAFKTQHPEQDQATAVDNFLTVIKKGIDQGFKEARNILEGLGVLKGDIASNIDKTYDLVQKKLDDFRSRMLEPATTTPPDTAQPTKG